jgi:RNA 2',3'-cyclic 3'-phosphodiesterase
MAEHLRTEGCGPTTTMRVFIALDIAEAVRERIARYLDGVREFAPEARWVRPETTHVTLKFIGEKPPDAVDQIKQALSSIQAAPIEVALRGCGFFPSPKAARVFWVGIEASPELSSLAAAVEEVAAALGIPREEHRFTPHLTLARGASGSAAPGWRKGDRRNPSFQRLAEKLAAWAAPEFGTMTAHEFFLYQSQLLRGGAHYAKIARFALS